MLKYFLANADDLWAMERNDVDLKTFFAIFLPLCLLLLSPALIQLQTKRIGANQPQSATILCMGKIVWPILFLIFVMPIRLEQEYVRLKGNVMVNIGKGFLMPTDRIDGSFEKGEALKVHIKVLNLPQIQLLNVLI